MNTHSHLFNCVYLFLFQDDSEVTASSIIERCSTPMLLSYGNLETIPSISLIGEGMVIAQVKPPTILNAVILLLSAYYTFNCAYPKGLAKNTFSFLDFLFLNSKEALPVGVELFYVWCKILFFVLFLNIFYFLLQHVPLFLIKLNLCGNIQ